MWLRSTPIFKFSKITMDDPIMLFASSPVGFPMLKELKQYYNNLHVATHYTKPKQKMTNDVVTYCNEHFIPCYFPVKKEDTKEQKEAGWRDFVEQMKKNYPVYKLGIACAYGYMIPEEVIKMFERGVILAHPSLIPKYRGGSPIFHAIANGEKESGISVMEVSTNKFDQGNLLYQVKHPLGETDSYEKVEKDLSELMASQIHNVINNLDTLRPGKNQLQMDVSGIPPHQLQAKIYKQKHLDINKPAIEVYNWSRAMIAPRVKFNDNQIIVFFDREFLDDPENSFQPGQLKLKGKNLYMKCSDKFLKLNGWQEITKKPQPIHKFINRFIDREKYNNEIFFK